MIVVKPVAKTAQSFFCMFHPHDLCSLQLFPEVNELCRSWRMKEDLSFCKRQDSL